MAEIDVHIIAKALTGIPEECGDMGFARTDGNRCTLALVDALGHGKTAHGIALTARTCLEENYDRPVTEIVAALHKSLRGTRGAVAAVCRLDLSCDTLIYSGVGNISLRLLGSRQERLVIRDGILGYMIPTLRQSETRLFPGDLLVMSSDGIREHYDPDNYPGMFTGRAEDIAGSVIRDLGRQTDDASCIVVRYGI